MGALMPTAFDENGRPVLIVYNEQGEPIRADAKAPANARLAAAREEMTRQATARAEQTRGGSPEEARVRLESVLRPEGGGAPQPQPYMGPQTKNLPQAAAHLNIAAAATLGLPALVRAPVAAGKALLGGIAGSVVGKEVGERMPFVGGKTAGKVLGAAGSLVGASVGPRIAGRQLANIVTGGRFGSLLSAAEGKAATAPMSAATEKRLAIEAERLVLKRRSLELAEKKFAERAAAKAQKAAAESGRPVGVQSEPTAQPAAAPAQTPVVVPATTGIPVAAAPEETIVLKLQQQMQTAAGRKAVREYLNTLPKEAASQIRLLLARGQAHPATVVAGGTRSVGSVPSARERGLGAELARMLGQ